MPSESGATQTDLSLETIVLFVSDMAVSRSFYEHSLGLRPLAVNPHTAMYSAGHVRLCLLPAAEHGVALQEGRDRSADITFMVENFRPLLMRCLRHEACSSPEPSSMLIGVTADFYDPDGHWFSLYQPSEAAMGWPSGPKLEALASSLPMRHFRGVPPETPQPQVMILLMVHPYVFLFFNDAGGGRELLWRRPRTRGDRRRAVPPHSDQRRHWGRQVRRWHDDADDSPRRQRRQALSGRDGWEGGVAMAFGVADLTTAVADLSRRGIAFSGSPSESPIGRLARFTDPAGHVFLLRESTQEGEGRVRAGVSANAAAEAGVPAAQ